MQVEALRAELMRLPTEERARLAAELLSSLDQPEHGDIEELWLAEAERRYEAYRSGRVRGISAEEAIRQARSQL